MMLFKYHYFVYLVKPNMLTWFNVKKTHCFSSIVHHCRFSMPRLSQTLRFLQKWRDIRPSLVTHTRNLCSAFNPFKLHTHSSEHTHGAVGSSMCLHTSSGCDVTVSPSLTHTMLRPSLSLSLSLSLSPSLPLTHIHTHTLVFMVYGDSP